MSTILHVKLATTESIDLGATYSLGIDKIDDVSIYQDDRILVKAQGSGYLHADNGIYVVQSDGTLSRSADFADASTQVSGQLVVVSQGTIFADTGWQLATDNTDGNVSVGTDQIIFTKFSGNSNMLTVNVPGSIILRSEKGYPLTITELDNNFKYLAVGLTEKLNIVDFNQENICDEINSVSAAVANLNSWRLQDLLPLANEEDTANGLDTIPIREANGNINSVTFTGDLIGNADTSDLADYATLANNIDGICAIVNGGSGANTADTARTNLKILGTEGKDTMTGTINAMAAITTDASLNIPVALAEPISPEEGDIWATTDHIKYRLNGLTQSVAPLYSPVFIGAPTAPTATINSNSTSLATTAYVWQHRNQVDTEVALKAYINSPTFTGSPNTTKPSAADDSTRIPTTSWVRDNLDSTIANYYTKSEINTQQAVQNSDHESGITNAQNTADLALQQAGIPVGSVVYFAANNAPVGYLHCNGRLVNTSAYPILFGKIGYTYGGSGSRFRLPDLRGVFMRGDDDGRGLDYAGPPIGTTRAFGTFQRATGIRILIDQYAQGIGPKSNYSNGTSAVTGSNIDGFRSFGTSSSELMRYKSNGGTVNVSSNSTFYDTGAARRSGSGDNISFLTRPHNVNMLPCIKAFGDIDDPDLINATDTLNALNNKVNVFGDVMTGFLTLHSNPSSSMHAATKLYVDQLASTVSSTYATKTSDNAKVPLAGGVMSGRLTLSADPSSSMHAATKRYVDNTIAGNQNVAIYAGYAIDSTARSTLLSSYNYKPKGTIVVIYWRYRRIAAGGNGLYWLTTYYYDTFIKTNSAGGWALISRV